MGIHIDQRSDTGFSKDRFQKFQCIADAFFHSISLPVQRQERLSHIPPDILKEKSGFLSAGAFACGKVINSQLFPQLLSLGIRPAAVRIHIAYALRGFADHKVAGHLCQIDPRLMAADIDAVETHTKHLLYFSEGQNTFLSSFSLCRNRAGVRSGFFPSPQKESLSGSSRQGILINFFHFSALCSSIISFKGS